MSRIKLVGLCLVAVFALGAVGASGAMATPSGPYLKVKKGSEAWTLGERTGSLNPKEEANEKITVEGTLKTGTKGKLYVPELYPGGPLVECNDATGKGEGGNSWQEKKHSEGVLIEAEVMLTGCTVPSEKEYCGVESSGAGEGNIVAENIAGRLGYNPEESEKGREEGKGVEGWIHPKKGAMNFTTIKIFKLKTTTEPCGVVGKYEVTGGAVGGSEKYINEYRTSVTLEAKVNAKFEQELKNIEFPEWNEETEPGKSEKQEIKGEELKFGKHPASLEGEIELYNPELAATKEPVEVGVFTTP